MSSQDLITQDMLEVLAKVQTDPQSKLFARGIKLGAPQSTEQPLTGKEPFLSAAERKLIRAHRERVEAFLYARAFGQVRDSEWGQKKLVNSNADSQGSTDSASAKEAAHKLKELNPDLLERVTSSGDPIADLKLALAIRPSSKARIVLGLAFQAANRPVPAINVLASVEHSLGSPINRAIAAANRALLHWDQAHYVQAALAYRGSLSVNPTDGRVAAFSLVSSLASGDLELVLETERMFGAIEPNFAISDIQDALRTSDEQGARDVVPDSILQSFCPKSQTSQQVLQFLIE